MRLLKRGWAPERPAGNRREFTGGEPGLPLQEATFVALDPGRHTGDMIEPSDVRADRRSNQHGKATERRPNHTTVDLPAYAESSF